MSWTRQNLGELVETQKGYAFKSTWYQDLGCPIVKVSDFTDDSIDTNSLVKIPANIADNYSRWELHEGEVVIQTVGSWPSNPASVVGKCVRVPNAANGALLNQNAVRLLPRAGLDNGYLYYSLRSPQFQGYIIGKARGSASQASITLEAIRAFEIGFPSVGIQARIASILSAYDDLIENNRRRIQLLEQAARLLYKEWFIHLRFPGHEHTKIIDGVPDGWNKKTLGHYLNIKHGYAFKGDFFSDEETGVVLMTPGNFKVGGGAKLDKKKYYLEDGPVPEDYILQENDLLVTMTDLSKTSDTLGYPMLVPKPDDQVYLHNQRLGKIESVLEGYFPKYYFYYVLQDSRYRAFVVGSASGTSVKHTSPKKILSHAHIFPINIGCTLIKQFDSYVSDIQQQINTLISWNINLAKARDLLLPRLMNGEVAV